MFRTVVYTVFVLAFACYVEVASYGRDLKQLRINWNERDGFSLLSNLVDITVNDGSVYVDSSLGTLHVDDGDVVIDSQILKLDTRQNIIVEVESGHKMKLVSKDVGVVDLHISKKEDLATVLIRPKANAVEKGETILVDFTDSGDTITISVGDNGEIVDVIVPKGSAKISTNKRIAKVNLVAQDVEVDITSGDKSSIKEKRHDIESSDIKVNSIKVTGSSIISSSSQA